ncbi:hypothetical protein I6M44_15695 [Shewanella algae]|nr:hypothetical protein [Shewanella algae]MBO2625493.1 hypothetical protein [Shewanella algae]BCV37549.1 hypothetical protein TUM17377_28770 [Shewanella chilikensis]
MNTEPAFNQLLERLERHIQETELNIVRLGLLIHQQRQLLATLEGRTDEQ